MLSLPHLIVLFLIALVVLGPEKLPEVARMLGKVTAEMRKMTTDFRFALEDEIRDLDRQARVREEETAMRNMPPQVGTIHSDPALPETVEAARPTRVEPPPEFGAYHPPDETPVVKLPDEKAPDDPSAV